jgi:hypothetical protein
MLPTSSEGSIPIIPRDPVLQKKSDIKIGSNRRKIDTAKTIETQKETSKIGQGNVKSFGDDFIKEVNNLKKNQEVNRALIFTRQIEKREKEIQKIFDVAYKENKNISDDLKNTVAGAAIRILRGVRKKDGISTDMYTTDMNTIKRYEFKILTTDGHHRPGLKETTLVSKVVLATGGFGNIKLSYNLEKGEVVTKWGKTDDVEDNNEEIQKDFSAINRIRDQAAKIKGKKEVISNYLVLGDQMKSSKGELILEMDKAEKDLSKALSDSGPQEKAMLYKEMMSAGAFLHELGFVHRDIKPQNFLWHDGKVKLTDFGMTRSKEETLIKRFTGGTPDYIAPEVLLDGQSSEGDSYSFGVIALKDILGIVIPETGNTLKEKLQNRHQNIEQIRKELSDLNKTKPNPFYETVIGLLDRNPKDRLSLKDANDNLANLSDEELGKIIENYKAADSKGN